MCRSISEYGYTAKIDVGFIIKEYRILCREIVHRWTLCHTVAQNYKNLSQESAFFWYEQGLKDLPTLG